MRAVSCIARTYMPGLAAVLIAVGYGWLLRWFGHTDFYNAHFFDHGTIVTTYQQARLLFAAYLAWLVYAVGFAVLKLGDKTYPQGFSACQRYALGFLTGACVWHVVLFGIGAGGLYSKGMAVGVTATVMLLSLRHLSFCLREGATLGYASLRAKRLRPERLALAVFFCFTAGAFLLVKGLYPAGGHDYYTHYFPFYRAVVERGSIAPNEVWYQFFYSKGAGLYFLAMLLTDPLAPQLVTTSFVFIGALIVFTFLRDATCRPLLPGIGATLYLLLLIYTPGPLENQREGGWGDMEKLHELTAVFALGVVWMAFRIMRPDCRNVRIWYAGLYACAAVTALLTFLVGVLLAAFLGFCSLRLAAQGRWRIASGIGGGAVVAGASVILILAVNYGFTSLLFDQFIVYSWPWADLDKLRQWGTMFEVLTAHWANTGRVERVVLWSWDDLLVMPTYLRLEIWWPLLLVPSMLSGWPFIRRQNAPRGHSAEWAALLFFLAAVLFASIVSGARKQPISFYRISSFSYGPSLCLVMLFCAERVTGRILRHPRVAATACGCVVAVLYLMLRSPSFVGGEVVGRVYQVESSVSNIVINASHLWHGRFSLKDAYQNQQGWPGRMPWAGIYPGIETPWKIVGPNTRIWSFHVHSYCMLPHCNVQAAISFRFSPHWATVFFGTPAEAENVLRAEGLNYFFFSKELSLRDPLPSAPLFAPEEIGKHLGVRWTDGVSYLLTWKGTDTKPLDSDFVQAYTDAAHGSLAYQVFQKYRGQWKEVADYLTVHESEPQAFFLPWCVTCGTMTGLRKQP